MEKTEGWASGSWSSSPIQADFKPSSKRISIHSRDNGFFSFPLAKSSEARRWVGLQVRLSWRFRSELPYLQQVLTGTECFIARTSDNRDMQAVFALEPPPDCIQVPMPLEWNRIHLPRTVNRHQKDAWRRVGEATYCAIWRG